MASYTWNTVNDGLWTAPSNWSPNTGYPQLAADVAYMYNSPTKSINITLNNTINLTSLFASSGSTSLYQTNIIGTGEIVFSSSTSTINAYNDTGFLGDISVKITATSSPLRITGSIAGYDGATNTYWNLKNPANKILQLGRNSGVGFDTVDCLGIQHTDYIFDNSSATVAGLMCTGAGGVLDKSPWSGTGVALRLTSDGTGTFKIGRYGVSVNVNSLYINGNLPLQLENDDNECKNDIVFATGTGGLRKSGNCRWIFSGSISKSTTQSLSFQVSGGVLQLLASSLASSTAFNSGGTITSTGCLEIKGTASVATTITLATDAVGPNRMGGLRATSNSNITVNTMNMGEGSKVAAALGATLAIFGFTVNAQNKTLYFGGEGTVDFGYALGGTLTTVAIVKEDSGTLKMSTNNKTYAAPTDINGGTLWCDGPNRISNSNLITVANGTKLRSSFVGTTALSVKALTLQAGSIVQVD